LKETHNDNKCRITKEDRKGGLCGGDEKYSKTLVGKSEWKNNLRQPQHGQNNIKIDREQ
jgi:hypothetical protein